jgi:hypothetical protein
VNATLRHDEGAYARCSYCGRYSNDPRTLGEPRKQPVCDCGNANGWSGSFVPPGPTSRFSRSQEVETGVGK